MRGYWLALWSVALVTTATAVEAQTVRGEAEGTYGGAWFADDGTIPHHVVAGAARWRLTPRLALGPEVSYMIGPGSDRDVLVTGNLLFLGRTSRLAPFATANAGVYHHRDRFFDRTFASTAGTFGGGGGVRIPLAEGWYLAPEFRLGLAFSKEGVGEPHVRFQVPIGWRF